MHTGSCLCGGVKFTIEGDLEPIQICHCGQCRKAQGSAFATNIPVPVQAFKLVMGAGLLRSFQSSPGKDRVFCKQCGSPVYSKKATMPDVLRIRAGLLDGKLATSPVVHFYTQYKANWWEITDGIPQVRGAYQPK